MSTIEAVFQQKSNHKIDRYVSMVYNQKQLVQSSKSIIRKRHSPLARRISEGDVSSIVKAAKDRLFGSINREKREELCRLLCDLKTKCKKSAGSKAIRDAIARVIAVIITEIINPTSGLLITVLWIIREDLYDAICKCKLNGDCLSGTCFKYA